MDPKMEVAYQYVLLNIQEMIILLLQIQKKKKKIIIITTKQCLNRFCLKTSYFLTTYMYNNKCCIFL